MGDKATITMRLLHCAFGAAATAAIFAGVQPSRLILSELPLSGGVAPGYSQYSLPGWIVLLCIILLLRHEVQRSHTCWRCHLCSKSILAWRAIP